MEQGDQALSRPVKTPSQKEYNLGMYSRNWESNWKKRREGPSSCELSGMWDVIHIHLVILHLPSPLSHLKGYPVQFRCQFRRLHHRIRTKKPGEGKLSCMGRRALSHLWTDSLYQSCSVPHSVNLCSWGAGTVSYSHLCPKVPMQVSNYLLNRWLIKQRRNQIAYILVLGSKKMVKERGYKGLGHLEKVPTVKSRVTKKKKSFYE